jgi:hypothetical protein
MCRLNHGRVAVVVHGAPAFERGNLVNSLASFAARRICGVDPVLCQSRFLKVALSLEVSRYARLRPLIGEHLTGLDSSFVPSPDSPRRESIPVDYPWPHVY